MVLCFSQAKLKKSENKLKHVVQNSFYNNEGNMSVIIGVVFNFIDGLFIGACVLLDR